MHDACCSVLTSLRQSQAELSPTLNLNDPHTIELLHIGRDSTALTASPAQLAKVPISPTEDHPLVSECQGLSIPATTGHLHDPVASQGLDTLGPELGHIVAVSKPVIGQWSVNAVF